MKPFATSLILVAVLISSCESTHENSSTTADSVNYELVDVKISDAFWGPKLQVWQTTTVNDVFDKFEGKYTPEGTWLEKDFKVRGVTRNAFLNFDRVAEGKRGIGIHDGPPWYDGLIYETIRGAADLLSIYPNAELEKRIDGYIDRIAAAQASGQDGYINTYTQLMEPDHRWGFNGGFLRWQHDVYNAGMLVEAGVHYYRATGKVNLLTVAVKMANYMVEDMGPYPKKNVVPAHSGPEEAFLKLYQLFRHEPALKSKLGGLQVEERKYFDLVKFWIEGRGKHVGFPLWTAWGNDQSEKWIRDVKYDDPKFGEHRRPSWGDYAQDSTAVLEQKYIVGHAVRATLLATGVAAMAKENKDSKYAETVNSLWDNMVGRRMFITGGVGAIAHDEKFGDDYFLPNDAYLETCAAVGAGFFSQRMNESTGNGKYIDEFERVLYNGVLTGINLAGDNYTYQNPLTADHHHRWEWHDCPCCPPMFLKIMAAIPDFIYSVSTDGVMLNLYVGNKAQLHVNGTPVKLIETTNYPWDGKVVISVDPEKEIDFQVKVRIPGWAVGVENPYGLYNSKVAASPTLTVNGEDVKQKVVDGYVTIKRVWKKGDTIALTLPMQPRLVYANNNVQSLQGMAAFASGPLVYCFENSLNNNLGNLAVDPTAKAELQYQADLLNGVNVILVKSSSGASLKATPYYAVGNYKRAEGYQIWINAPEADDK